MKQHDNSEAMRLADYARGDEYQRAAEDAVDLLRKQSAQIAELEAERDQHQHTATSLLSLLADIRKACGDNGKRMQPELVELIGELATERERLRAEVERLTKPFGESHLVSLIEAAIQGHASTREAMRWFAGQITPKAARTHKETE